MPNWLPCIVALTVVLAGGPLPAAEPAAEVRSFEIVASKYKFEPSVVEVTEGDRVVLTMRSSDSTHGFGIKEFKVKRRIPKGGDAVSIEFVAEKAGSFRFICSEYCGGGHSSMK